MMDNDTSCRSQKCPLMHVAVVILVRAKRYQFRRWEIFGCWPNIHVLTATGGAV